MKVNNPKKREPASVEHNGDRENHGAFKDYPVPKTGGYPATGVEKATWPRRGVNAQTKARKGAGPLA